MSHLRILQVSDLQIDQSPRAAGVLHVLELELDDRGLLQLDYLVVCGNLTKNGRPKEFELAAQSLAHFAKQVLRKDSQANRLLVVPGDRDVSEAPSEPSPLHHFNQFLSMVREKLDANPTPTQLSPKQPIVRRLKGLTLIGVPYWQGAPAAALEKGIQAAASERGLSRQAGRGSVVAYHSSTPTILASSQSPLMEFGARRSLDDLKSILEKDLRIDFHLFGAAPVVLVTLEPFAFRHVGISTGPRAAGSPWPIRFNVLEIGPAPQFIPKVAASRKGNPASRSFAVMSHKLERPGGKWEANDPRTLSWATYLSADKSAAIMRTLPHRKLVDVLNHWADTGEAYLRIDHLPGSGVDKWLDGQDKKSLRELKAKHIVYQTLKYDGDKVESDHKWVYRSLVDTMQKLAKGLDNKKGIEKNERWAVFHDQVLPRIDGEEHSAWLETVKAEAQKQIGERGRFLYLVPRTPYTSELTRLFPEAQLSPVLDSDSRDELLRSYDPLVPFRTDVLERLTGGCLGFGAQLLEEVQNQFVRWPDAQEILDTDLEALIGAALESGPMQQLTREFNHSLESLQGGRVLALIRQKVLAKPSIVFSDKDTPVTFTSGELQRELPDRERLSAVLKVLVDHGVIVKEGHSDEYRVLALAPFLVQSISPPPKHTHPEPPRGDIETTDPSSAKGHVFISYSGRRTSGGRVMKDLVSDLQAGNVECWHDDRLEWNEFDERIMTAIENARFAVLLLDRNFARSKYIQEREWPAIRSAKETRGLKVFTIKVRSAVQKEEINALVSLNNHEALSLKSSGRRDEAISEAAKKIIALWERGK